jgi:VWFA-related protein
MLESYVGESKTAVAVVAFDSRVQLFQDFTEDMPAVSTKLKSLSFGDDGAAILDALSYSMGLLDRRPAGGRRVVILIGETRDHGSHTKFESIAQRAGVTNTLIYSLSFSPVRAEVVSDLKTEKASPNGGANLAAPILMAFNGFRKNVSTDIAKLSGGEYLTFGNQQTFDSQMAALADGDRSRYLLSFQPADPKPGRHTVSVRLRNSDRNMTVTARTMYWAIGRPGATGSK